MLVEGNTRAVLERRAEEAIGLISAWSSDVGVAVSSEKSTMMLLKGRLSYIHTPIVSVNSIRLTYSKKVKYLGINVGERIGGP